MTTFYTFHKPFNQFGKTEQLTGRFELGKLVEIGPSFNNTRPPFLYASDNWNDFVSTLARVGVAVPRELRDAPLGIFETA